MWKDIGKNPVLDIKFLDRNGIPIVPGVMISYKSEVPAYRKYIRSSTYFTYIPGKTITKTVFVKELLYRVRMLPKGGCEVMKALLVYDKRKHTTFRIYRYDLTEVNQIT